MLYYVDLVTLCFHCLSSLFIYFIIFPSQRLYDERHPISVSSIHINAYAFIFMINYHITTLTYTTLHLLPTVTGVE